MQQAFPVRMTEARAFSDRKRAVGYFEELVWQFHEGESPCLFLPSLIELSKSLGCSILDVQCALMSLRRQGYDYFTLDIHSPITLWYPVRLDKMSTPVTT